jgi:hypothetical protein
MVNADVGVVAPTGLANAIAIQRAEFVDTLMHGWTVAYHGRIALTLVNQDVGGGKRCNLVVSSSFLQVKKK